MGNMARMSRLTINDEGIIDLRRNPPATRVQVQGGIEAPEPRAAVDVVAEPPPPVSDEPLPGRQKTTEGLAPVPQPVKVIDTTVKPHRIDSSEGVPCYAIVGRRQWERLNKWHWVGTRGGKMFRRVKSANGVETVLWFHREAANCNRNDLFVGFLDGDERNCVKSNLKVCMSKEEAKAIRRQALSNAATK